MNWLALFFLIEAGIAPKTGLVLYESADVVESPLIGYTHLDATVELFGVAFFGGGVKTLVSPTESLISYSPNNSIYDFRAGLHYKGLEIGWRHRCWHPVYPYLSFLDADLKGLEGAYDEVYVQVSGKLGGKP